MRRGSGRAVILFSSLVGACNAINGVGDLGVGGAVCEGSSDCAVIAEEAGSPEAAPPIVVDAAAPDEGPPDAPPPDTAKPDTGPGVLRAFVLSAVVNGAFGGVPGADALCSKAATMAALGGTYRAWLSIPGADAIDHITSAGPWQLVTGEIVAPDKVGLASGTLKHLIDKDEKGVTVTAADDHTWTGTGVNGRYVAPDCSQWTSTLGNGSGGDATVALPGIWTAAPPNAACSDTNRIYCFEL